MCRVVNRRTISMQSDSAEMRESHLSSFGSLPVADVRYNAPHSAGAPMAAGGSSTRTNVVVCDWAAQAFLDLGGVGRTARTAWCFLSELESSGVPSKVADYVRDTTRSALETRAEADVQLRSGHLGIHKEMLDACDAMAAGRSQLMERFLGSTPRCRALREAWRASQEQRASQAGERAAAIESLARRVASALRRDHHAIVDDFLPAPFCAARCCGARVSAAPQLSPVASRLALA